jgi:hypothetical protein
MWARSQNWTSDSQSFLQSCLRPPNYTRCSVHAHIPIPARNVRAHILVPATAVRVHIPVCAIGVHVHLSFPSAPTFPLSPTRSAPIIPYVPLRPHSATCLRLLARRRGGPGGSQHGQGKSDLPWPSVNAHLTLTGWARRSIGCIGRASGRPALQTTLDPTADWWTRFYMILWMNLKLSALPVQALLGLSLSWNFFPILEPLWTWPNSWFMSSCLHLYLYEFEAPGHCRYRQCMGCYLF